MLEILDKFEGPIVLFLLLVLLKLWDEYSKLRDENKELQTKLFEAFVAETAAKAEQAQANRGLTSAIELMRVTLEGRR